MKTSHCQCGNRIYFENTQCLNCNSTLGYLADEGLLSALTQVDDIRWRASANQRIYRKCRNYEDRNSCNWMIADSDPGNFCVSCQLSEIIPNLSKPENVERWKQIERAKRRLIYSLLWLGLPIIDKKTDPENGLSFRLMEDHEHYSEFAINPSEKKRVITGHVAGTITLNIEEADSSFREDIRNRLQESYRTILGHLRHESGHYYWDRLVKHSTYLNEFRDLFGDEQENYQEALNNYYQRGPKKDWQISYISAYACSHPWEDWAECWAHYLHMIDTMETANDFGDDIYTSDVVAPGQQFSKQYLSSISINQLIDEWSRLSVMLNEMNRSLGQADAYPFNLTNVLRNKIGFIHKVITSS
jgi:hypothetical protein